MCNMELYFKNPGINRNLGQRYRVHSIISEKDEDRLRFSEIFKEMLANKEFNPNKLGLTLR